MTDPVTSWNELALWAAEIGAGQRLHRLPGHPDFTTSTTPIPVLGYDIGEVSTFIIENAKLPFLSKLTSEQLAYVLNPPPFDGSDESIRSLLRSWLHIFDRVFFFKSLSANLQPILFTKLKVNYHGIFIKPRLGEVPRIEINILQGAAKAAEQGRPANLYLGTLLHEMVHAFLAIYSCGGYYGLSIRCKYGNDLKCAALCSDSRATGITGHGQIFCETLVALNKSFDSAISWELDHGICSQLHNGLAGSLYSEVNNSLEHCMNAAAVPWVPDVAQLASYGLEIAPDGGPKPIWMSHEQWKRKVALGELVVTGTIPYYRWKVFKLYLRYFIRDPLFHLLLVIAGCLWLIWSFWGIEKSQWWLLPIGIAYAVCAFCAIPAVLQIAIWVLYPVLPKTAEWLDKYWDNLDKEKDNPNKELEGDRMVEVEFSMDPASSASPNSIDSQESLVTRLNYLDKKKKEHLENEKKKLEGKGVEVAEQPTDPDSVVEGEKDTS